MDLTLYEIDWLTVFNGLSTAAAWGGLILSLYSVYHIYSQNAVVLKSSSELRLHRRKNATIDISNSEINIKLRNRGRPVGVTAIWLSVGKHTDYAANWKVIRSDERAKMLDTHSVESYSLSLGAFYASKISLRRQRYRLCVKLNDNSFHKIKVGHIKKTMRQFARLAHNINDRYEVLLPQRLVMDSTGRTEFVENVTADYMKSKKAEFVPNGVVIGEKELQLWRSGKNPQSICISNASVRYESLPWYVRINRYYLPKTITLDIAMTKHDTEDLLTM